MFYLVVRVICYLKDHDWYWYSPQVGEEIPGKDQCLRCGETRNRPLWRNPLRRVEQSVRYMQERYGRGG